MKKIAEFCLFLLLGAATGLIITRISTEASLLATTVAVTQQNQDYCEQIRVRDNMLLQLEEENRMQKQSLDTSVEMNAQLAREIETLHTDIDRLSDLIRAKERTINVLQDEVQNLRKLLETTNGPDSESVEETGPPSNMQG